MYSGNRLLRRLVAAALLAAAALAVWGARSIDAPVSAAPHTIGSDAHPFDPDWPDVYLILATKCLGCHAPGTVQCDLSDYAAVIAATAGSGDRLVVPGKPSESLLLEYVNWNVYARRDSDLPEEPMMPAEQREWLTAGQIETIRRWIARGALEYRPPADCQSPRQLMEIDFPSARQCKTCHPTQYDQWARSMHHYAQHSPVFEAFNLALIERTGGTIGTFCTRCHTPIGTALGENGSRRNVHRSRLSMEGVTCVACHRIKTPNYKNNARFAIEPGKMLDTCVYGPFDDPVSTSRTVHPAAGSKYLKSAAFCGTCHDVTSPEGVRLEEAFSEYQNSPAARAGVTCQHCHMGPDPGVPVADRDRPLGRAAVVPGVDPKRIPLRPLSDHTFAGPDYSLLPDTEFPEKLDWMYEKDYRDSRNLTPHEQKTLRDLRRRNRRQLRTADAQRYRLLRNAATIGVTHAQCAAPGERLPVRVDVTSKVAGHNFPTGFTAERQAWVEITVFDPAGTPVFRSGDLDAGGDLRDEHNHRVEQGKLARDKYLMNFQSKFTALTFKGTERSVVLSVNRHLAPLNVVRPATGPSIAHGRPPGFRIAKSSIPPLATVGRTYPVRLGKQPGIYRICVQLNFRHLPPVLLDHVGTPHLKKQLEVVVIDRYEAIVTSESGCLPGQATSHSE